MLLAYTSTNSPVHPIQVFCILQRPPSVNAFFSLNSIMSASHPHSFLVREQVHLPLEKVKASESLKLYNQLHL